MELQISQQNIMLQWSSQYARMYLKKVTEMLEPTPSPKCLGIQDNAIIEISRNHADAQFLPDYIVLKDACNDFIRCSFGLRWIPEGFERKARCQLWILNVKLPVTVLSHLTYASAIWGRIYQDFQNQQKRTTYATIQLQSGRLCSQSSWPENIIKQFNRSLRSSVAVTAIADFRKIPN